MDGVTTHTDFPPFLSTSQLNTVPISDEDLDYLWHLVERKDGGPPWKHMMERSTPNMSYQAWQRDLEVVKAIV